MVQASRISEFNALKFYVAFKFRIVNLQKDLEPTILAHVIKNLGIENYRYQFLDLIIKFFEIISYEEYSCKTYDKSVKHKVLTKTHYARISYLICKCTQLFNVGKS